MTDDVADTSVSRVIVSYGRECVVEGDDGQLVRCRIRGRKLRPLCGDRVEWRRTSEAEAVVEAILPRRNELLRHDLRQGARALAANVDQLVIVVTSEPPVAAEVVDRYLAGAEILRIPPLLVRNKTDLPSADEEQLREFEALGYITIDVSAKSGQGIERLRTCLEKAVSAFTGPSGVGKSSLLTALDPALDLRTGALSQGSGEGTHTTTATRLYPFGNDGALIDSPGVRDFRLWPMNAAELQHGFTEFGPYRERCRFPDCSHVHEPGCEVSAAAAEGRLSPRRLDSYRRLLEQLADGRAT